jgi:PAS domain S-box-containing protein
VGNYTISEKSTSAFEHFEDTADAHIDITREDEKTLVLSSCARQDLFKHFLMSACSRAMKRGDGIMSKHFCLNDAVDSPARPPEEIHVEHTELPSLIDIATAREEMRSHFWSSHQARKDNRSYVDVRLQPTDTSTVNLQHIHEHHIPIPATLRDAFLEFGSGMRRSKHQPRPIAITSTEPPFTIIDVNKEWTHLCGYTREEAIDSTLQDLLQGADTNVAIAKSLTSSLLKSENGAEHEAVLVNYRSDGRKFRNHVRVGRIKNEDGKTTHFVGVFRKLDGDGTGDEDLYENV